MERDKSSSNKKGAKCSSENYSSLLFLIYTIVNPLNTKY